MAKLARMVIIHSILNLRSAETYDASTIVVASLGYPKNFVPSGHITI
jgi:hypothetical protein